MRDFQTLPPPAPLAAERARLWETARAALAAVDGARLTAAALSGTRGALHLLAIGKAACAMARGALAVRGLRVRHALLVTKHGHGEVALRATPNLLLLEAGHPLPDAASFAAGAAVLAFVRRLPAGQPLLVLLSGGASALAEMPAPGLATEELLRAHAWLLGSGLPIGAVNRVRRALSALKGGRLALAAAGRPTRVLLLSDVYGDRPVDIGSGPFTPDPGAGRSLPRGLPAWLRRLAAHGAPAPPPDHPAFARIRTEVVSRSADAARAALAAARTQGWPARMARRALTGDAVRAGADLARAVLAGPPGVTVWHGETTVRLPPSPGRGGRNRQLALAGACALAGHPGALLLALATDGGDGDDAAGALVDGGSVARGRAAGLDPAEALARCDAGGFLDASGDTLYTGPTGTNVRDLVLGLRLRS